MDIPIKNGTIELFVKPVISGVYGNLEMFYSYFIQLVGAFTMILGNSVDFFLKKILYDLVRGVLN